MDRSAHRFRDAGGLRWTHALVFFGSRADTPVGSRAGSHQRFALSPLNKRRWDNFKANRRGYWSLWIFLALFVISLFAEFIANDKPIYIHVNGQSYFPALVTYPDTAFSAKKTPICSAPPPTIATIT